MFASVIKSSPKCTLIYTADVISRQHFHGKNIGRIKVNNYLCSIVYCKGESFQDHS